MTLLAKTKPVAFLAKTKTGARFPLNVEIHMSDLGLTTTEDVGR